jgi:hypothetical protein
LIQLSWTEPYSSFATSSRAEYISFSRRVRLLLRLFVAAGTCLPNRSLAMDLSASIHCRRNVC